MLVFFVTQGESTTLAKFFGTWAPELGARVRLVYYDDLARLDELPGAGCYVFTDLERLTQTGLQLMAELADTLAETGADVINHPGRVLRRYDLLRVLHERGVNPFQIYRAVPLPAEARFPVFLRSEHEHRVITSLLWSQQAIERELIRAYAHGLDLTALLLVEYQDVSDEEGMFHRYISHVIGDAIIPGYLAFGTGWVVKGGPFLEGRRLAEQRDSVVSRAREPLLREVTQLAGVRYGRFDYAVADGRVFIWELNTNPTLLLTRERHRPEIMDDIQPLADRLTAAFEQLAGDPDEQRAPVALRLPGNTALVARRPRLRWPKPVRGVLRLLAPLRFRVLWLTRRRAILAAATRRAAALGGEGGSDQTV